MIHRDCSQLERLSEDPRSKLNRSTPQDDKSQAEKHGKEKKMQRTPVIMNPPNSVSVPPALRSEREKNMFTALIDSTCRRYG